MDEPTPVRGQRAQKKLRSRRTKSPRPAEAQDGIEEPTKPNADTLGAPELKFQMRSGEPLFIIRLKG